MDRLTQLRIFTLISFVLGSFGIQHSHRCTYRFLEYLPSPFETLWLKNAHVWGASTKDFCQAVKSQKNLIQQFLAVAHVDKVLHPTNHTAEHEVLSRFKYERKCVTAFGYQRSEIFSFIEPLVTSLRQPASFCLDGDYLGRTHYVLSSRLDPTGIVANHTRKAYIFDLGASTWSAGAGGSSQNFFFYKYKSNGLEFSRMFLWEVKLQVPSALFSQVPDEVLHAYQYFNIPANLTPGCPRNPLEMIRKVARPDDFVVVKLDIDNSPLEAAFIDQLLNDASLMALVDEMFFEHHVNFEPLSRAWGSSVNASLTLADSYNLFFKFRQRGVRFHGWP